MNLPNKLTVLRVVLVPFFVAALLISKSVEPMNCRLSDRSAGWKDRSQV